MKSYLSSQLEVIAAINGSFSKLIVPVKSAINSIHTEGNPVKLLGDWPLSGYEGESGGLHIFNIQTAADDYRTERISPPYPPESLIYFREAWRTIGGHASDPDYSVMTIADFVYKASEEWNGPWNSPATMPRDAARIYAKLGEPTVELVEGIWNWAYPATVVSINGKPE